MRSESRERSRLLDCGRRSNHQSGRRPATSTQRTRCDADAATVAHPSPGGHSFVVCKRGSSFFFFKSISFFHSLDFFFWTLSLVKDGCWGQNGFLILSRSCSIRITFSRCCQCLSLEFLADFETRFLTKRLASGHSASATAKGPSRRPSPGGDGGKTERLEGIFKGVFEGNTWRG